MIDLVVTMKTHTESSKSELSSTSFDLFKVYLLFVLKNWHFCILLNGVSEYLYPQVPVPTYIYIDCNVNFKVLKNREDSSDFDDF